MYKLTLQHFKSDGDSIVRKFSLSDDWEDSELLLIVGITELTLSEAVEFARQAREKGIVTAGIPVQPIADGNKDMRKFREYADAVILTSTGTNSNPEETAEGISDLLTKAGFVNLDIEDVQDIFRDTGTVYFGTGIAGGDKRSADAAGKALETLPDICKANRILINITTGTEIMLGEMSEAVKVIEKKADPDVEIIWGHVIDEEIGYDVKVTVFAALNDKERKPYD